MTSEHPPHASATQDDATVTLLEEVAHVDVHAVLAGRVRISTQVEIIEELARADLQGEVVEVSRVTINQPVLGEVPQIRTEGDETIVPVFEEVMVIEKRLMLKEELHLRKRTISEPVAVPVQLRHQTAIVERLDENGLMRRR